MQPRQRARRVRQKRRDLVRQQFAAAGVFVAQIDVDVLRFHGPRRDERALQHAVRVRLHADAVLERARLALVRVQGDDARLRLRAYERPLARRRKARAAQPAQPGCLHGRDHVLHPSTAGRARGQRRVAARGAVGVVAGVRRHGRVGPPLARGELDVACRCAADHVAPDDRDRRGIAAADAGCRDHPCPRARAGA